MLVVKVMSWKLARTVLLAFIVTVQVLPLVELQPVQLEKVYPDAGLAVSVTLEL